MRRYPYYNDKGSKIRRYSIHTHNVHRREDRKIPATVHTTHGDDEGGDNGDDGVVCSVAASAKEMKPQTLV